MREREREREDSSLARSIYSPAATFIQLIKHLLLVNETYTVRSNFLFMDFRLPNKLTIWPMESRLLFMYMQVNVPNNCSYNIVTVKCGHCTMVLSMDLSPFHQARTVPDNQVQDRSQQLTLKCSSKKNLH